MNRLLPASPLPDVAQHPTGRPGQRPAWPPLGLRESRLACAIAETIVAAAFGVARSHLRGARRQSAQAILARQVAMYLAHVGFGIPMAHVAKAFRRDRTTVTHACHLVEDRRGDCRFDGLLDRLEAAAVALRAACLFGRDC